MAIFRTVHVCLLSFNYNSILSIKNEYKFRRRLGWFFLSFLTGLKSTESTQMTTRVQNVRIVTFSTFRTRQIQALHFIL